MTTFAWHVHHDVLVEPVIGSLQERIDYIRSEKPVAEQPLRLRLLKEVKGELPAALDQAWAAHSQAWDALGKAWDAYGHAEAAYGQAWAAHTQAWAAYNQAWDACMSDILALHAAECPDCPWDGQTIFPKKKETT